MSSKKNNQAPAPKCMSCHGFKEVRCNRCYGSGKLEVNIGGRKHMDNCNLCFGRGKHTCTVCSGKGVKRSWW